MSSTNSSVVPDSKSQLMYDVPGFSRSDSLEEPACTPTCRLTWGGAPSASPRRTRSMVSGPPSPKTAMKHRRSSDAPPGSSRSSSRRYPGHAGSSGGNQPRDGLQSPVSNPTSRGGPGPRRARSRGGRHPRPGRSSGPGGLRQPSNRTVPRRQLGVAPAFSWSPSAHERRATASPGRGLPLRGCHGRSVAPSGGVGATAQTAGARPRPAAQVRYDARSLCGLALAIPVRAVPGVVGPCVQ